MDLPKQQLIRIGLIRRRSLFPLHVRLQQRFRTRNILASKFVSRVREKTQEAPSSRNREITCEKHRPASILVQIHTGKYVVRPCEKGTWKERQLKKNGILGGQTKEELRTLTDAPRAHQRSNEKKKTKDDLFWRGRRPMYNCTYELSVSKTYNKKINKNNLWLRLQTVQLYSARKVFWFSFPHCLFSIPSPKLTANLATKTFEVNSWVYFLRQFEASPWNKPVIALVARQVRLSAAAYA